MLIKLYKKSLNGRIKKKADIALYKLRGYEVKSIEDVKQFNGAKGCLLFLLFPPLVFFGRSKYERITYSRVD
jgi:hypothetical protein